MYKQKTYTFHTRNYDFFSSLGFLINGKLQPMQSNYQESAMSTFVDHNYIHDSLSNPIIIIHRSIRLVAHPPPLPTEKRN